MMIYTGYGNFRTDELIRKAHFAPSEDENWRALALELAARIEELQKDLFFTAQQVSE